MCAEKAHNVKIHRRRESSGHKSASIAIQHTGKVGQPLDFEDFAFSFLQKVNGQEFYSTPGLAESMARVQRPRFPQESVTTWCGERVKSGAFNHARMEGVMVPYS